MNSTKTKLMAEIPLGVSVVFQLWVLLFKTSSDLGIIENILTIPFGALMLLAPFIWSYILIRKGNPMLSLAVTIPSAIIYLAAYYIEFVMPYSGGGASMIYAVAPAYAFTASGICYFIVRRFTQKKINT
jgi:hypothetical protein